MIRKYYAKIIGYGGLTFLGIITFIVRYTLFQTGISLNKKYIAPLICKGCLFLVGVRVKNNIDQIEIKNAVFLFNHNSFLDIFIIPVLRLENTRFIISEVTKKIIPLHLCNLGVDVLYIPDSNKTNERIKFFKNVSRDLVNNKYNVICSPEGRHDFFHGVSSFNKGVFHMAMTAKSNLRLIFFDIPRDANPLSTTILKPCLVQINEFKFDKNEEYTTDNVVDLKNDVRKHFLEKYKQTYGDYGDSVGS